MDGIICVDKPTDHTSFDVIARIRGILQTRKVGHGGTLDPMATGVLPIFIGRATKCSDLLPVERKRYLAVAQLGCATDTQDCTGTVTVKDAPRIRRRDLEAALTSLADGYEQLPPMYSAIQQGGRRLYDLARQGVEVEREKRHVILYRLELLDFDETLQTFTLDVECSKGTYVRTLCYDAACLAGSLAMLSKLRRTMSAGFTLEDCVTLEQLTRLSKEKQVESVLLPTARVFDVLPRVFLNQQQALMLKNGVKLDPLRVQTQATQGPVAFFSDEEAFLATGILDAAAGEFHHVKLFCDR